MAFTPANHFEGISLEPVFQPVTNRAGDVQFLEMLVRPSNAQGRLISPTEFIADIERRGANTTLRFDTLMLQHAVKTLNTHPHAHLSVNVSALTVSHPKWNDMVDETLRRRPELMERLGFEVTETKAVTDMNRAVGFAESVHARGGKILIDDCGDGHFKNLNPTLLALKPDALKITSLVVSDMHVNQHHRAIFDGFHRTAQALLIPVIAEGIANAKLLQHVRAIHPDGDILLQGHAIAKPSKTFAADTPVRPSLVVRRLASNEKTL